MGTKKMGACNATEGSPQLDCGFPTEVSYFSTEISEDYATSQPGCLKTPVFLPTLLPLELGGADYKVQVMDMEAVKKVLNDHFMVMLGDASYKGTLGEYMIGPGMFGIHTPEEEAAIAERAAAAAEEKEAAFLESLSDLDRLQYRIEKAKAAEAEAAEAEAAAAKAEAEAEKKPEAK